MSRALDKATAAALQSGDPDAAFRAISDVLTEKQQQQSTRLEIEFLGRGHPPVPDNGYVLRDGNAVAIPKLALVQAFLVARKILQRYRSIVPPLDASSSDNESILRATAVLLLMDPEHLTAANTRKRLIQAAVQKASPTSTPNSSSSLDTSSLLDNELHLVDSLLTSHLHRHTKSPTLWSHRRWLISFLSNSISDNSNSLFQDITQVVMVAGVRHPRNYYAWDHARWLVQRQNQRVEGSTTAEKKEKEKEKLVVAVRDWCYRHHTDTSGWSFLFFLLASLPSAPPQLSPLYGETVAHVEQMATSLRWAGEAVWVFLRTAVAYLGYHQDTSDGAELHYDRFTATASSLLASVAPASHEHQILLRAQKWYAANAVGHTSTSTTT